jgi:hypothetical protein
MIQTDFKLTWKQNSSLQAFQPVDLSEQLNNSELDVDRSPREPRFSMINTHKKGLPRQSEINLEEIRKVKLTELENKKGFLKRNFIEESTGVEVKLNHSKNAPISQKMIQELKFGDFESGREISLDRRRFWELKAQIARDIFSLGKELMLK